MKDKDKTKEQLIDELAKLRQRYAESKAYETKRKIAEEALRESETRFRSLFKTITEGVILIDLDGQIIQANPAAERILGLKRSEIENRSYVAPEWEILRPDGTPMPPEEMAGPRAMKEMRLVKNVVMGTKRPDGYISWINVSAAPILNEAGELEGVVGTFADITGRKQAEESLREKTAYLDQLFESVQEGIVVADNSGKVIRANKEFYKLFRYNHNDVIGKSIDELVSSMDFYTKARSITLDVAKGKKASFETMRQRKDKKIIDVSVLASSIMIDGEAAATYGIYRDISERKRSEEKIKAALKEKEVMLKEIHHRVKNNMQIMSSLLKLQFARTKSKKLQEMLKTSQNRIHSMALIHEKLYQSKDFARIDFAYYIRSLAVHLFHSYRVNTNIVRLETDVRDVHLDINRAIPCGLIVNELVSNSLKHAFLGGREGEISIKFYSNKQGKITLVVSDNGVGFPEDIDFRSTESFGMQVVNDLVEQLGGTIELDRKGGTTFKVVF